MAPSGKEIEKALLKSINEAWQNEREQITVKFIRSKVEKVLNLRDGFFKEDEDWKAKSKSIITDEFERLESDIPLPSSPKPTTKAKPMSTKQAIPAKKETQKRVVASTNKPPPKRQKKEETPSDNDSDLSDAPVTSIDSDSSELSDLDDEEEDAKVTQKKARKSAGPATAKRKSKAKSASSEDELQDSESDTKSSAGKSATKRKEEDLSDSEMSVLIDEEPKTKKSRTSTSAVGKSTKKTSKAKAAAKPQANLSPEEMEMKTLQGQLKMCGVNKIWGFELKQFGEDNKAKIRHLKGMLKEIGLEGRFSKDKADEIKERRELMADIEAIKANAASLDGPRERRSKVQAEKALKLGSDSEESDLEEAPVKARVAAAKQDLAFLGSESESD